MSRDVYAELLAMVGEQAGPFESEDEVNRAMIRHWCEAMEDANPLYTDEDYARTSEYGGVIAPPPMVQAYCLAPLWPRKETGDPLAKATGLMDEAGYHGVVATGTSQEYIRPLRPGDRVSYTIRLAGVSPEKNTRVGRGHFITAEYSYSNQHGELVCVQPFTVLKFKPAG